MPDHPVPASTYRLQFQRDFPFKEATRWIKYLHELGADWLYASPYLKARPDSTHGYDVSDHNSLNPAIGTERDYERLTAELAKHGMGQLLDIVPNHMGIGEPSNHWWMDVLEHGPASPYGDYFDVDWLPLSPLADDTRERVLLPVLGDQYGRVLEKGELRLVFEEGRFELRYYETRLPVSPESFGVILEPLVEDASEESANELRSILNALRSLPSEREDRYRETNVVKRRLAGLLTADPPLEKALLRSVEAINGRPDDPQSWDRLDDLVAAQHYRLAYWRVASEEINYRRFFDVNDLAAIRMEREQVFEDTHRLVLRLVAEGKVTGLRLDHPDGLWDPAAYTARLQEAAGRRLYVVAEKIVAPGEWLPEDWQVDGTVGYEYLNALGGLFVNPTKERAFEQIYERFVGETVDFHDLVHDSKQLIMRVSLASETNVLARILRRISARNRRYRDFTLYDLRNATRELIACFPVYRTYVREATRRVSRRDRTYLEQAFEEARRRNPATDVSYFEFLRDLLLLRLDDDPEARRFVMKFQQVTGPVTAKGVEDTAFYVYNRLVALNEVGGEPAQFGTSTAQFHRLNQGRLRRWPYGLNTTSTHDTKRSEDVRARLAVLSEIPREWAEALRRWERLNRRKKRRVAGVLAPDRNEEYLLYQSLLGAWPIDAERLAAYLRKATKEAKVNTSWISPNEAWDAALTSFAEAVLADEAFLQSFRPLQEKVATYGMLNGLSQVLLKMVSPGVPDVYQGQELWDYSLVDPDNRRPVDFALRARLLAKLRESHAPADLLDGWTDGRIKLWVTHRALRARRDHRDLFLDGGYLPLAAQGRHRNNVVAFARVRGDEAAIALAPRLVTQLPFPPLGEEAWADATLALDGVPSGRYRDVLADRELVLRANVTVAELLAELPLALLVRARA